MAQSKIPEATRLSAFLPCELKDALERLARGNDRTLSAELRCAVKRHLAEHARS